MRVLLALLPFALAWAQTPALTTKYCAGCHNEKLKTAGLSLTGLDPNTPASHAGIWEKVLRQIDSGQMPPPGLPRPDAATAKAFTTRLVTALDRAAAAKPDPGLTMPHRLNRAEYSNAIRDLLALDTKPGNALPVDESGNGFDNMADLLSMSPALLERYLSVARQVSRLAVGDLQTAPGEVIHTVQRRAARPDPESLPLGATSGIVLEHYFPLDAEYDLKILMRGNGEEDALAKPTPYSFRVPVKAGLHRVVATFLQESTRNETALRSFGRVFGPPAGGAPEKPAEMDLRLDGVSLKRSQVPQRGGAAPDIASLIIGGPHNVTGRGATPSRERIFVCRPVAPAEEAACAGKVLTALARRAFRRPVTDADIRPLTRFYEQERTRGGDFDDGIANALQAILVSPDFLFRVERDPKGVAPGAAYRLGDHALAARLSFFLWSSIPDNKLLALAEEGRLHQPAVLRAQVERMLADPKSDALISNFGGQWLYLRTLAGAKPDPDIFGGFDENLRHAFQRETELYLDHVFRGGRSLLELLDSNYTFLNQRLAEHYKIPNVYGAHFRKVELTDTRRGGLLGQGSILTVTSYPNRTSVVQRGKWILENMLGTPPPPPPADVPALEAVKDGKKRSLREALEVHRANAICAGCHARMDPIGFALENFDGVGGWRLEDGGHPVDAKGKLPGGRPFEGPGGLKKLLLDEHKDEFVHTVAEKLLMYALGRGLSPADQPAVRAIARRAATENYRLPALVAAVVDSVPFQMRRAAAK